MGDRTCTFNGCPRAHMAKGLCSVHYNQQLRGKPLTEIVARGPRSKPARVAGYDAAGGSDACWTWTGSIDVQGYGVITRDGITRKAHRYVWEQRVGPIPAGLVLDHICFNPACVNPAHLRPITQKQNSEHLQGATKASTTGVRNVFARAGKYVVQVRHNRRLHHIGTFATIEEATLAAEAARKRLFSHAD